METIISIGLDIHGVIDTNPKYFSNLTRTLYRGNWQVHIMTGSTLEDPERTIKKYLENNKIYYTHLFSISDYLREKYADQEASGSTQKNPWFPDETWNTAKAEYCLKHDIQLCLDDSTAYLPHFKTPIARYYSKNYEKRTS